MEGMVNNSVNDLVNVQGGVGWDQQGQPIMFQGVHVEGQQDADAVAVEVAPVALAGQGADLQPAQAAMAQQDWSTHANVPHPAMEARMDLPGHGAGHGAGDGAAPIAMDIDTNVPVDVAVHVLAPAPAEDAATKEEQGSPTRPLSLEWLNDMTTEEARFMLRSIPGGCPADVAPDGCLLLVLLLDNHGASTPDNHGASTPDNHGASTPDNHGASTQGWV